MNLFSINRNSYLQNQSGLINPRIINRSVDLARKFPIKADCSYFEPPWFRPSTEQPDLPTKNADVTRRPLAFGVRALPKLRQEIHHEDPHVVKQALLSLADLMHDPEMAMQAIRLKIPARISDKLLDSLAPIREQACLVLSIIARHAAGREAIITDGNLLENLCLCLGDAQTCVRLKVAACFEMIARSWIAADVLVNADLIKTLLEIIDRDEILEIVELHLETLKSLMYECGKCLALKIKFLNHNSLSLVHKSLDCLTILTSTRYGKKLAMEKKLFPILIKLLHYGNIETCTKAASILMFCTIKTRSKFIAAEHKTLPKYLMKLMINPANVSLQMFCLKILANICEHPDIREIVRKDFLEKLMDLPVGSANLEYKKTLLKIINWVPQTIP